MLPGTPWPRSGFACDEFLHLAHPRIDVADISEVIVSFELDQAGSGYTCFELAAELDGDNLILAPVEDERGSFDGRQELPNVHIERELEQLPKGMGAGSVPLVALMPGAERLIAGK